MNILVRIKSKLSSGFSPYFYIRKFISNLKSNNFKKKPVKFTREISEINKIGYAVLNSKKEILNEVLDRCSKLAKNHQIHHKETGKTFWNIIAKDENLVKWNEIKSYISSDYFKSIAEGYLGTEAILARVDLILSFPTKVDKNHSQLWHLDADDTKICTFYFHRNRVFW